MSEREPFDRDHSSFWLVFCYSIGVVQGTVLTVAGTWRFGLIYAAGWGFIWLLWAFFLLGRRAANRNRRPSVPE